MTHGFAAIDIRFSYAGIPVLRGADLSVNRGEIVAIAGQSGCGKSTLLQICASLIKPDSGTVLWDGTSISSLSHDGLNVARRKIGFVFQKHALIHNFRAFDNVALPLRYHFAMPERDIRVRVRACMEELGLFNVDARYPNELSAGQSRCVSIARAIVAQPSILFLDEPTAGMDPLSASGIGNVLLNLQAKGTMAIVMICNTVQTLKQLQCNVRILENGIVYDQNDPEVATAGFTTALRETV